MDTFPLPDEPPDRHRAVDLKFYRPLQALLGDLHKLFPDPKRKLHYDQYLVFLLLAYFNPVFRSMRGLQAASEKPSLRERLQLPRTSLGSLSEAASRFDAEYLHQIFLQLAREAGACDGVTLPPGVLEELQFLAVDGTLWSLLPRMAREFYLGGPRSGRPPGVKLHAQFDVVHAKVVEGIITDGYASERRVLEQTLRAQAFYLLDAGYIDFTLFQKIIDIGSHFLIPARPDTVYKVEAERVLTPVARGAGVLRDGLVRLGSEPHAAKLRQPLRVIHARVLQPPPHNLCPTRRQGKRLPLPKGALQWVEITLITSDLKTEPELLVQLYRFRWQVELFFRWLKCVLGCQHFFSESENGMALSIYAALIATLLVVLYTGLRPTRRIWELIQLYLQGWVSAEDVCATLEKMRAKAAQKKG